MTQRYLGGIITANPVEPSENFSDSAASGMWTMQEALSFSKSGDWPDSASINPSKFIENIFSTFLYDGNGSTQSINNGIDLSNKGGLVWFKGRTGTLSHRLFDTERGATISLRSNATSASVTEADTLTSFNADGFSLGADSQSMGTNVSGAPTVSWTFRKQPKFFDIASYTGDGSGSDITISHNLGCEIGFALIKRDQAGHNWYVMHRESGSSLDSKYGYLDNGNAFASGSIITASSSSSVTFSSGNGFNTSGKKYVVYLFAHNDGDGGFGSTGDKDIIKCGSYTGNGSTGNNVTLGFEPQWILVKRTDDSEDWTIYDTMRGVGTANKSGVTGVEGYYLEPHNSDAEASHPNRMTITSTGFMLNINDGRTNASNGSYIYVAIRRGLMKAPTASTQVFDVQTYTGNAATNRKFTTGFPIDANIITGHSINYRTCFGARLYDGMHETSVTDVSYRVLPDWIDYDHNDGYDLKDSYTYSNANGQNFSSYSFRRAQGFFDVVAYPGTGSTHNINHNLGVAPELIILKNRDASGGGAGWLVGVASLGSDEGALHNDNGFVAYNLITTYGTTTFTAASGDEQINKSGDTYIAYLFATLAGVSKVGTYSGTGSDVNVDCGFTNNSRFVLVKRTDSTGSWYVWDSGAANGIADSTDPYFLLDSDAARVTNTDYIDPLSSGFTITSNAGSDLNHNGGTYVFLAIA